MANVTKRGKSYRIVAYSGYDSAGKQIKKSTTFTPEEGLTARQEDKAVQKAAFEFEEKVRTGNHIDASVRFSDFAERWVRDYAKPNLARKTVFRYEELLTRINGAIGNVRLDRLQPHQLIEFYASLGEPGVNKKTGGGCLRRQSGHTTG